jgi:hypothetical protein
MNGLMITSFTIGTIHVHLIQTNSKLYDSITQPE